MVVPNLEAYLAASGMRRTMSESSLTASKPTTVSHKWIRRVASDELYRPAGSNHFNIKAKNNPHA